MSSALQSLRNSEGRDGSPRTNAGAAAAIASQYAAYSYALGSAPGPSQSHNALGSAPSPFCARGGHYGPQLAGPVAPFVAPPPPPARQFFGPIQHRQHITDLRRSPQTGAASPTAGDYAGSLHRSSNGSGGSPSVSTAAAHGRSGSNQPARTSSGICGAQQQYMRGGPAHDDASVYHDQVNLNLPTAISHTNYSGASGTRIAPPSSPNYTPQQQQQLNQTPPSATAATGGVPCQPPPARMTFWGPTAAWGAPCAGTGLPPMPPVATRFTSSNRFGNLSCPNSQQPAASSGTVPLSISSNSVPSGTPLLPPPTGLLAPEHRRTCLPVGNPANQHNPTSPSHGVRTPPVRDTSSPAATQRLMSTGVIPNNNFNHSLSSPHPPEPPPQQPRFISSVGNVAATNASTTASSGAASPLTSSLMPSGSSCHPTAPQPYDNSTAAHQQRQQRALLLLRGGNGGSDQGGMDELFLAPSHWAAGQSIGENTVGMFAGNAAPGTSSPNGQAPVAPVKKSRTRRRGRKSRRKHAAAAAAAAAAAGEAGESAGGDDSPPGLDLTGWLSEQEQQVQHAVTGVSPVFTGDVLGGLLVRMQQQQQQQRAEVAAASNSATAFYSQRTGDDVANSSMVYSPFQGLADSLVRNVNFSAQQVPPAPAQITVGSLPSSLIITPDSSSASSTLAAVAATNRPPQHQPDPTAQLVGAGSSTGASNTGSSSTSGHATSKLTQLKALANVAVSPAVASPSDGDPFAAVSGAAAALLGPVKASESLAGTLGAAGSTSSSTIHPAGVANGQLLATDLSSFLPVAALGSLNSVPETGPAAGTSADIAHTIQRVTDQLSATEAPSGGAHFSDATALCLLQGILETISATCAATNGTSSAVGASAVSLDGSVCGANGCLYATDPTIVSAEHGPLPVVAAVANLTGGTRAAHTPVRLAVADEADLLVNSASFLDPPTTGAAIFNFGAAPAATGPTVISPVAAAARSTQSHLLAELLAAPCSATSAAARPTSGSQAFNGCCSTLAGSGLSPACSSPAKTPSSPYGISTVSGSGMCASASVEQTLHEATAILAGFSATSTAVVERDSAVANLLASVKPVAAPPAAAISSLPVSDVISQPVGVRLQHLLTFASKNPAVDIESLAAALGFLSAADVINALLCLAQTTSTIAPRPSSSSTSGNEASAPRN